MVLSSARVDVVSLRFYRRRPASSRPLFSASSSAEAPLLPSTASSPSSPPMFRDPSISKLVRRAALAFAAFSLSVLLLLYAAADSLDLVRLSSGVISTATFPSIFPNPIVDESLEGVLKSAADDNHTVILTTLNEAWATPDSLLDLFLKSFAIGDGTKPLLDNLVIVALDQKAYERCKLVHKHCYALGTEGVDFHKEAFFMTRSYLKMMWRRIDFLRSVLEMGYNFVFTDADIMWFRNPFPQFYEDADFQIACDNFWGRSDDMNNRPNGGFKYVKSNKRSIEFYRFWHAAREIFPGHHDQDVLNLIKYDPFISQVGVKIRFLDTAYFGGLCEPSKDLNLVCTMHVNCCVGMDNKIGDLKVMIQDWRAFMSLPLDLRNESIIQWRVPRHCSIDDIPGSDSMAPDMAPAPAPNIGAPQLSPE